MRFTLGPASFSYCKEFYFCSHITCTCFSRQRANKPLSGVEVHHNSYCKILKIIMLDSLGMMEKGKCCVLYEPVNNARGIKCQYIMIAANELSLKSDKSYQACTEMIGLFRSYRSE